MSPLVKEYGLFIIIAVLMLALLPPILTPYFGLFGTYASYIVTALVLCFAKWLDKKAQKKVDI